MNAVAPGTVATSGLDQYPQMIQDHFRKITEEEIKEKLGISYVVQQSIVKDEKKMIDEFQRVITGLVEKKDARTMEWL